MKLIIYLVILLLLISPISSKYIPLPYKQTLSKTQLLDTVTVNFEVKDTEENPLKDTLIIIQGISDPLFNQNLVTNINGQASIALNLNEIFIYTLYKITYEEKTGNFFTNSNKNIAA